MPALSYPRPTAYRFTNAFLGIIMKTLNKLAVGAAMSVALVAPVSAAVVQGIYFDENNTFEVDSGSFLQSLDLNTGELSGHGLINSFNNSANPIPAGRELTYAFNGFMLDEANSSLNRLIFTGGQVQLFSDGTPNFDIANGSTATDSEFATPWLELTGSFFIDLTSLASGTLAADLGSGFLRLDVTGGAAEEYFDTDSLTKITGILPTVFGWADVAGRSSVTNYYTNGAPLSGGGIESGTFEIMVAAAALDAGVSVTDPTVNVLDFFKNNMDLSSPLVGTGSIDLTVKAQAVPEPATIALLGGALLGLAVTRRRRS